MAGRNADLIDLALPLDWFSTYLEEIAWIPHLTGR
ncbi:MAG: hypothetical protein QOK12_427 [Mycobacterium sp.]|jgi:hypothetical protein|nr:hypothetical protein [Mycobacterium sp.]